MKLVVLTGVFFLVCVTRTAAGSAFTRDPPLAVSLEDAPDVSATVSLLRPCFRAIGGEYVGSSLSDVWVEFEWESVKAAECRQAVTETMRSSTPLDSHPVLFTMISNLHFVAGMSGDEDPFGALRYIKFFIRSNTIEVGTRSRDASDAIWQARNLALCLCDLQSFLYLTATKGIGYFKDINDERVEYVYAWQTKAGPYIKLSRLWGKLTCMLPDYADWNVGFQVLHPSYRNPNLKGLPERVNTNVKALESNNEKLHSHELIASLLNTTVHDLSPRLYHPAYTFPPSGLASFYNVVVSVPLYRGGSIRDARVFIGLGAARFTTMDDAPLDAEDRLRVSKAISSHRFVEFSEVYGVPATYQLFVKFQ